MSSVCESGRAVISTSWPRSSNNSISGRSTTGWATFVMSAHTRTTAQSTNGSADRPGARIGRRGPSAPDAAGGVVPVLGGSEEPLLDGRSRPLAWRRHRDPVALRRLRPGPGGPPRCPRSATPRRRPQQRRDPLALVLANVRAACVQLLVARHEVGPIRAEPLEEDLAHLAAQV